MSLRNELLPILNRFVYFDSYLQSQTSIYLGKEDPGFKDVDYLSPLPYKYKLFILKMFQKPIVENIIIRLIDNFLKNKHSLLSINNKYDKTVTDYFNKINTQGYIDTALRYDYVLNSITELWKLLGINPELFYTNKDFEVVLQRIQYYRDHYIHSFNVFLLGYIILNELDKVSGISNFKLKHKQSTFNMEDIISTWVLASTFHDAAYPIEKSENWLNELFEKYFGIKSDLKIDEKEITPYLYLDFMKWMCKYNKDTNTSALANFDNVDWKYNSALNTQLVKKDHGVFGALFLLHIIGIREQSLNNELVKKYLPAAHAICTHNMLTKIDFTTHPYAFLLVLCDELQDWGRPTLREKDYLYLEGLRVTNPINPIIEIRVLISQSRTKYLQKMLSKDRLITNSSVHIEITDQNNKKIVSL